MSTSNAAKQPDSKAFDDLLGRLVDELAMSPALPQPDPAPQLVRAPEPFAHGATESIVPPVAPARSNHTAIAVAAIIAGSIVALGLAAMLILPGGSRAAASTPASPTAPAATPTPPAPPPVTVPLPVPAVPEAPPEPATDAAPAAPETATAPEKTPTKKPKKSRKRPPSKTAPKKSGDGFDDL